MVRPKLYGTDWDPGTNGFKNYLRLMWIPYDYFDIENYQAAADEVKKLNDGELVFPLVRIGEDMLINPSRKELNDALVANGLLGSGENYGISK